VLCLDMDGQASLSRALFGSQHVEGTHPASTIAGLFDDRYDPSPSDVIQATPFHNLSLVAAGDALESHNVPHPDQRTTEQYTLQRFLSEVHDQFDIVLIDTGPNTTGLLGWSSLAASDFVLSPVLADSFGTQSVISVQRHVEAVQSHVNQGLRILGYVLNMIQRNTVNAAYEQTLRQLHAGQVLKTSVPLATAYREAIAERAPITLLKAKTKAARVIKSLTKEIGDRIVARSESKEAA